MIESTEKGRARQGGKDIHFGINKRNPSLIDDLGRMYYQGSGAAGLACGHR
jgi:hypothetical protein